jgi:hypothetical protein
METNAAKMASMTTGVTRCLGFIGETFQAMRLLTLDLSTLRHFVSRHTDLVQRLT